MVDQRPIGILDSGIGGLTVLDAIRRQHPTESLLYVADNASAPYGPKSQDEILAAVVDDVAWLVEQQAKVIVLACNSATISVIEPLRQRYANVPIVGVVPMVKPAALHTTSGVVAVFGTEATLSSDYYARLKEEFASNVTVLDRPVPWWVAMVEAGEIDHDRLTADVEEVLAAGADVLVLGCTHFPLLKKSLERIVNRRAAILESSDAVARQVGRILDAENLRASGEGSERYNATGSPGQPTEVARVWLGRAVPFGRIE